jgi:hypothetical protein
MYIIYLWNTRRHGRLYLRGTIKKDRDGNNLHIYWILLFLFSQVLWRLPDRRGDLILLVFIVHPGSVLYKRTIHIYRYVYTRTWWFFASIFERTRGGSLTKYSLYRIPTIQTAQQQRFIAVKRKIQYYNKSTTRVIRFNIYIKYIYLYTI